MRLTEKITDKCGGVYEPITNDRECCDKLGQLEDIEEEAKVDLLKEYLNESNIIID